MNQSPLERLLLDIEGQEEALLDYWRARVREWCKNRPVSDNEKQPTNAKAKNNK